MNALLRSRPTAFTYWALVETLGGVLSSDQPNLENQILVGGPNTSNRPPLEESANTNPIKIVDPTLCNLTRDNSRKGSDIVVWWKRELAGITEVQREVTGGFVDGVGRDGGGKKAEGKSVIGEARVSRGGWNFYGFGVGGLGGKRNEG